MHMTLPRFGQWLGTLPRWGDAPSLRSVAGGTLPRFAQSLGGCSLASLSRWGDAPSLFSVTGGMLPCFAQSLGGRSLALLSCWGMLPRFAQSLSIQWFHQIGKLCSYPHANKLLQKCVIVNEAINLHSRGPTEQYFYVWESHHDPSCWGSMEQ